jgi:hypothetical protein
LPRRRPFYRLVTIRERYERQAPAVFWAQFLGLPLTHFIAAAGALAVIPLTQRWNLQTGAGIDLTPSMHWPAPITTREIEHSRGPVLVTVDTRACRAAAEVGPLRHVISAASSDRR